MKLLITIICSSVSLMVLLLLTACRQNPDINFVTYTANPAKDSIGFYLKDASGKRYGSLQKLKDAIESKGNSLMFAMNGGMYKPGGEPLGLYVEDGKEINAINTDRGAGNFYLKPNGILYITNFGTAGIVNTDHFRNNNIRYATQSGPLLLINGKPHPAFKEGSANLQIRNGAGILPDGRIIFALSKSEINFYDFAVYFKEKGCKDALYLDGYVSRAYLPEKEWLQTDGDFGVIIAVMK